VELLCSRWLCVVLVCLSASFELQKNLNVSYYNNHSPVS